MRNIIQLYLETYTIGGMVQHLVAAIPNEC